MVGDGRVVRRHVEQIHAHHQRPEKGNKGQQTDSTQLSQAATKEETLLDIEDMVLSGDKLEEPGATEAAGLSETDQGTLANTSPVRKEVKLPSYLTDFPLN